MAASVVLKRLGFEPMRDVLVQPPARRARCALLTQDLADAALLSPSSSLKADELDLVRLASSTDLNVPFMTTATGVPCAPQVRSIRTLCAGSCVAT